MRGEREGEAMIRMYCMNLIRKRRGREERERWERKKWGNDLKGDLYEELNGFISCISENRCLREEHVRQTGRVSGGLPVFLCD